MSDKLKKIQISVYERMKSKENTIAYLETVLNKIKQPGEKITKILSELSKLKGEQYKQKKEELPSFTVCGIFEDERKADKIKNYTGIVVLDLDKIESTDKVEDIKKIAKEIPYTIAAFISPSRLGLKILAYTNLSEEEHHRHIDAYQSLKEYYEYKLNHPIDKSGKDLSRLCFFSGDENIFINYEAKPFFVPMKENIFSNTEKAQPTEKINVSSLMEKILIMVKNKGLEFIKGSRTNFIVLLCSYANMNGISEKECLEYCKNNYPEDECSNKFDYTVKDIYRRYKHQHNKYKNLDNLFVDKTNQQKITNRNIFNAINKEVENGLELSTNQALWLILNMETITLIESSYFLKYISLINEEIFCGEKNKFEKIKENIGTDEVKNYLKTLNLDKYAITTKENDDINKIAELMLCNFFNQKFLLEYQRLISLNSQLEFSANYKGLFLYNQPQKEKSCSNKLKQLYEIYQNNIKQMLIKLEAIKKKPKQYL